MKPFDVLALLLAAAIIWQIIGIVRDRRRNRRPDVEEVDVVAAAISRCYGHGPFRLLDQLYQDEFRRDARAAIKAMRRRGSS